MTDPIGSEPLRHPLGRRRFMAAIAGGLIAGPLAAEGQQAGKVWRIGVLSTADGPEWEAFRQGLRTLGYVEGQNMFIEYRWHAGKCENLPALASDLVKLKVDVIVTAGPQPRLAARAATAAIPIVFVTVFGSPE